MVLPQACTLSLLEDPAFFLSLLVSTMETFGTTSSGGGLPSLPGPSPGAGPFAVAVWAWAEASPAGVEDIPPNLAGLGTGPVWDQEMARVSQWLKGRRGPESPAALCGKSPAGCLV